MRTAASQPSHVSVVIPAHNAALLIKRCIHSVLTQDGGFTIVPIVVDDGSTDDTISILEALGNDKIHIIRQENQGPASARNRGLQEAAGQYIAFLDADDYWRPGFLSCTVGFLETHPESVAVSVGQIHKCLGRPPVITPRFLQGNDPSLEPQILDSFFAFWAEHNHVCTGSVLMRTEIARQTGGQRAEFRICEDLEFWAYLATFGKWGFIPRVLFVSDGGAVTKEQGWLEKNKRRWASAPTVEEWQRRIVDRVSPGDTEGFQAARARIARNLAYSMILSRRDALARQAMAYCDGHVKGRVGRLLSTASRHGCFAWKLVCSALRLRESARDRRLQIDGLFVGKRSALEQ